VKAVSPPADAVDAAAALKARAHSSVTPILSFRNFMALPFHDLVGRLVDQGSVGLGHDRFNKPAWMFPI
jgi:hypothetical protein